MTTWFKPKLTIFKFYIPFICPSTFILFFLQLFPFLSFLPSLFIYSRSILQVDNIVSCLPLIMFKLVMCQLKKIDSLYLNVAMWHIPANDISLERMNSDSLVPGCPSFPFLKGRFDAQSRAAILWAVLLGDGPIRLPEMKHRTLILENIVDLPYCP